MFMYPSDDFLEGEDQGYRDGAFHGAIIGALIGIVVGAVALLAFFPGWSC